MSTIFSAPPLFFMNAQINHADEALCRVLQIFCLCVKRNAQQIWWISFTVSSVEKANVATELGACTEVEHTSECTNPPNPWARSSSADLKP